MEVSKTPLGGEEILWSGSVSHWHYGWRWLFVVLLLVLTVATFFSPVRDWFPLENRDRTLLISRGVLVLVAVIIAFLVWLDRGRRKYVITNRRVSVEYGIVSNNSNEVRIQDIRSINLVTQGLSGLIGIGRLEFSSAAADDAEVIFWFVPGAEKVRDLVRSLQAKESPSTP